MVRACYSNITQLCNITRCYIWKSKITTHNDVSEYSYINYMPDKHVEPMYVIISYCPMKGFLIQKPTSEENLAQIWKNFSRNYSSVLFRSKDGGKKWFMHKKKGDGAFNKIMEAHKDILSKKVREYVYMDVEQQVGNTCGPHSIVNAFRAVGIPVPNIDMQKKIMLIICGFLNNYEQMVIHQISKY